MRAAGLDDSRVAGSFRRTAATVLVGAWLVLVVAGGASLVFEAASVSGLSLVAAAHWSVLSQVVHTGFGRYWAAQSVFTVAIGIPVLALARRPRLLGVPPDGWIAVFAALAAGIAFSSALNGHARTLGHASFGVPSLAVHLLAVGTWVGGLGMLVVGGGLALRHLDTGPSRSCWAS